MKVSLLHSAIGEVPLPLDGRALVLGRSGHADVEISWDERVSRRHAKVWRTGRDVWFEDLGSSNGSWLGDRRLVGQVRLEPGMSLLLGETVLLVDAQPEDAPRNSGPDPTAFLPLSRPDEPREATMTLRERARPRPESGPPAGSRHTRAHPRFFTAERVDLRVDQDDLRVSWLRDISKGGLFVESDVPPPLGRTIEVQIHGPAGTITLRALVVHVVDVAKARETSLAPGVGVQFVELTPEQRQALQRHVDGLVQRLAGDAPGEVAGPEKLGRELKLFFDQIERDDLYGALSLPPSAPTSKVVARLNDLRHQYKRAREMRSPLALQLQSAVQVLDRVEDRITDPTRRLEYDFRAGLLRAEERIAQARAGTGPSLAALRRAWLTVAPSRVDRAAFLTRQAFAARQRGALAEAVSAGKKALEDNPFFDELRVTVRAWEGLLERTR